MTKLEIQAVKLRNFINRNFSGEKKHLFTSVIVTAAGSGTRMGGVSKQLLPILGKPCIAHSLLLFQQSELVDEILITARPEEVKEMEKIAKDYGIIKLAGVVPGGETRQESVKAGFLAIDQKSELLLIHDAARPLLTEEDLSQIVAKTRRYGAACAACSVTDTLKEIDAKKGFVTRTVPREGLVAVQTPQGFRTDLYRIALALAEKDQITVTDDCALAEHAGFSVYPCETSRFNFKLTVPSDLPLIEALLKEKRDD